MAGTEFATKIVWRNGQTYLSENRSESTTNTKADRLNQFVAGELESMSPASRMELAARYDEMVFRGGLRIGETPVPYIPTPIIQDAEAMSVHSSNILKVHQSLVKIEQFAFSGSPDGNSILEDVVGGMSPEGQKLMMGAKNVSREQALMRVIRFDTFHSGNGNIHMIEANTIATEGIHYHDVITKAAVCFLKELGVSDDYLETQLKSTATRQVFAALCGLSYARNQRYPNTIGIVFEPGGEDNAINKSELPYVSDSFRQIAKENDLKTDVVIGKPSEVDASNGRMSINGKEVDIIWRNNINPQDYLGLSANGGAVNADGLLEVISHPDRYLILNDDRTRFEGYKESMAYLHNPEIQRQAGITTEEVSAIDAVVPFTFDPSQVQDVEVAKDTLKTNNFLLKFAEHFVIKPKVGTHGDGVAFGVNGGQQWRQAVDNAIGSGKFIAQQYIPYSSIIYKTPTINPDGTLDVVDHYMDTNVHVIGGRVIGTNICRSSPVARFGNELGVLNVAAGGGVRPSLRI